MLNGETLRAVADRQAITDLIYRYCRAVDRLDPELGYSIWNEGAEADYGAVYRGSGRGWMDFTCNAHRNLGAHSHQVTNILIKLSGATASSESYVTATVRMKHEDKLKLLMVWGRYVDQWSYRHQRWGIDKRIYVDDFSELREACPVGTEAGRRDKTDASYSVPLFD